ncbi:MAG: hypothetical protein ACP5J4_03125 [Anaerolineae bacterium]
MKASTVREIGEIVYNASGFDPKNWRNGKPMTLPEHVVDLFALLRARQIDYVLVGGVALLQYVEGRNTQDIDLILATQALKALPEVQIVEQNVYFARGQFETLRIDFLLTEHPLFKKVQQAYTTQQSFEDVVLPCATVEGLLLLKLYALPSLYRQGDFARVGVYENDIATLMHYYTPSMPALLAELRAYLDDSDWQEVERIVEDIEQRLARFAQAQADEK